MTSVESNNWFPFQSLYNSISNGKPPEAEVKEKTNRVQRFKAGEPLSPALRDALGIKSRFLPPPWLGNMQRYGPPPSYPDMDICGLNSPLPHNSCKFGYHPGGWGYPSVDAFGNPVYGGNPFDEPCIPRKEANLFAARIQSLAKTFLIRCRFLRKRRAASRIAALGRGIVARRRYFKARIWLIVIQAYGRRFMERQRYLKKLENIITVQSCARRFLIVNSEDLKKARAAKSERKQLAQDAARMSVRKFMKRFRKKQDKERKERVNEEAPGVEEEDGSLLVEDTLLCQTLDASHFCMEDSVLTVILDNDNYCLDENAFCRVLDAVENPEDEIESETSDHGVPGRGKKAKGFKEDEEIIENGFCYEDSIFSRFFENDVDTVVCGVIDKWEGKKTVPASKDSASIIDKQKASTVLDQVDKIKDDEARNESGRLVEETQAGTDENLKVDVVETVEVESINNQTKASIMDGVSMSSDHSAGPALKLISEHDVVPDASPEAIEDEQNPGVVTTIPSDAFQPAEAIVEAPAEAVQTLENSQGEAPTSDPTTTEDNETKMLPTGQISAECKETETDSIVVKQKHSLPLTVEGDNGTDSYAADVLNAAAQALTLSNSEVFDTFPSNSVTMPDPHKAAVISVSAAASVAAANALAAQRVLSASSVAIPDASAIATPPSFLSKPMMRGETDPDGEKAFTEAAQMDSSLLNSNGFLKDIKPFTYSPFLATNEGLASEQADMKFNGAAERLRKQMESLTAVRAEIDEMLRVSGRVVYKSPFIPTTVYPSPTTVQAINFAPSASYDVKVTPQSPPDNTESPTAEETLALTPTGNQENDFVTQGTGEEKNTVSESNKLVESILDSCRQQAAEAARFPRAPYVDSSVGSSARSLQFLVHQKHEQISKQRGGASAGSDTGTNSTQGEQSTILTCHETLVTAENNGLTASANGAFKPHTSVVPLVIHEMNDQTFTQDIPPVLPRLQDGINHLVEPSLKEMKVDMMSQHSDCAPMLPSKNMYKSRASYLLALAAAKKQSGMSGPAQTRIST